MSAALHPSFVLELPDSDEPEKLYIGRRAEAPRGIRGRCKVFVREGDKERSLVHRGAHSDAFEWGYGGSGPADLARSILWDYLEVEPPARLYQDLKYRFIVTAPYEGFTLPASAIAAWLGHQLRSVGG